MYASALSLVFNAVCLWAGGSGIFLAFGAIPPPSRTNQPPHWAPTYLMNESTIAMPCNASGFMDPSLFANYGSMPTCLFTYEYLPMPSCVTSHMPSCVPACLPCLTCLPCLPCCPACLCDMTRT